MRTLTSRLHGVRLAAVLLAASVVAACSALIGIDEPAFAPADGGGDGPQVDATVSDVVDGEARVDAHGEPDAATGEGGTLRLGCDAGDDAGILYFSFDEGEGGVVRNCWGVNDGKLIGVDGGLPEWIDSGVHGGALRFASAFHERVQTDVASLAVIGGALTVSAWVRRFPGCTGAVVGTDNPWVISATYSTVNFHAKASPTNAAAAAGAVQGDGTWQHVAAVVRPTSQVEIWIAGTLQDAAPFDAGATASTTTAVYVGGGNAGTTSPFEGDIDEVRVFSRALNSDEIRQLASEFGAP